MGEAFIRVASDYPTILDVILEQVQNALDANSKKIFILLTGNFAASLFAMMAMVLAEKILNDPFNRSV